MICVWQKSSATYMWIMKGGHMLMQVTYDWSTAGLTLAPTTPQQQPGSGAMMSFLPI